MTTIQEENLLLRKLLDSTVYTLNECVNTIHEHQHNDRHLQQMENDARLLIWEIEDTLGQWGLSHKNK